MSRIQGCFVHIDAFELCEAIKVGREVLQCVVVGQGEGVYPGAVEGFECVLHVFDLVEAGKVEFFEALTAGEVREFLDARIAQIEFFQLLQFRDLVIEKEQVVAVHTQ